jgi:hypothetical protein
MIKARVRRYSPGSSARNGTFSVFRMRRSWSLGLAAVLVIALVLGGEASELYRIRQDPDSGVDYFPAVQYVAARHKPGEPVYVALPTPAYLALGSKEDLVFVSGKLDDPLAKIYALRTSEGGYVDYWIGAPTIVTTGQLCTALLSPEPYWLIVDGFRLGRDWAYEGEMAEVMVGLTRKVDPNWPTGIAMVRKRAPDSRIDPAVLAICSEALVREGLDEPRFTPHPR